MFLFAEIVSSDVPGLLVNYGPFGLLALGALTDWVWFRPGVRSLQEDNKRVRDQRDALLRSIDDKVLPTVATLVDAVHQSASSSTEIAKAMSELSRDVRDLARDVAAIRQVTK